MGFANVTYPIRDGTGQDFLDPTGKFQNHRRLTGRSTGFFTENFCSLFNVSYQKFSKGCMGEVLKFVTLRGGLRKKCKNICVFCKNDLILRPFLVKFRFEWPVLSSAKREQNKHKKNWRVRAKLLDILFNGIMQKAKKWSYSFLAICCRLFSICRAANTKLLWHWLENIRNIMCPSSSRNAVTSEQAMVS